MKKKEMTCIRCPLGCALTAQTESDGSITVTGNTCPRGAEYARSELTNPKRTVTGTVPVAGREQVLSVKTAADIPKEKIWDCMEEIKKIKAVPPVHIGDVILKNVADTGVAVVATKNML